MTIKNNRGRRLVLTAAAAFLLVASPADTQPLPNLFRQRPATTMPGSHGKAAHAAPIDAAILSSNPTGLTIPLPGQPDLIVERRSHQLRSARSRVWRGRGQTDGSVVTLTEHEGLLFGHIQSGNEVFAIRPGTNGRTIIEKLDPDSFALYEDSLIECGLIAPPALPDAAARKAFDTALRRPLSLGTDRLEPKPLPAAAGEHPGEHPAENAPAPDSGTGTEPENS